MLTGITEFERGPAFRERQREGIAQAKAKGSVFKGGKVRFDPAIIWQKRSEGMKPTDRPPPQLQCSDRF
ncbi:MAG: hypothetical protein ACKVP3_17120 [Hyphomicrobiaceae bacterium]